MGSRIVKPKDVLAWLGLRPSPKVYGYTVDSYALPVDGEVRFANWGHPKCNPAEIKQGSVDELRRYLSPGDAVLDIGAHSGDSTILFALAVGPSGRVFAVEPNRYVLAVLRVNATLNPQAAPIEVLPYAATATTAKLVFNYSDRGYCNGGDLGQFGGHGHLYPLDVEGRNILDELKRSHPDWLSRIRLLKTDTEGNDHAVIDSLRELVMASRPYLVVEVYKRTGPAQRQQFLRLLTDELHYDCFEADDFRALRGKPITASNISTRDHFDMFCVPKSVQAT